MANRLRGLDIAEISTADRGANSVAKVVIRKRDDGFVMDKLVAAVREHVMRKRNTQMASIESIAKALRTGLESGACGYNAMAQIAKQVCPNFSEAKAFEKCFTNLQGTPAIPGGPEILAAHLRKAVRGHGSPRVIQNDDYSDARRSEVPDEDDDSMWPDNGSIGSRERDKHGEAFEGHVSRIQREQRISRSAAYDRALKEPNVREHFDRSIAKSRRANAAY
jgi:hypothetical protein